MTGREKMMKSTVSTAMTASSQAGANVRRRQWLNGGSVLAAATALAALGSADAAEARSGIGAPGVHSSAPGVSAGRLNARRVAPREVVGETVSVPRLPQRLPNNRVILPNAQTTMVAPNVQQQITQAPVTAPAPPPAPSANVPSVPAPQNQSTQQTGSSVQPISAPVSGDPGNNVQANAAYDDTQIDFAAGGLVDTVTVLAPSAIIDWTTFNAGAPGTEVIFLDTGDSLAFESNLLDYTVLNRIFTPGTDLHQIRIDGNVTSTVNGGLTGGNVWFYSPGGLIIGANASFNVGSLLLTTSAPDPTDVGNPNFDVSFLGTPDPTSAIVLENDGTNFASITANNQDSYVAMVAPRIVQGGTVEVNGSTAYVAAEEATLTIQNGLFDISVDLGSEDGNGIVHTGTTGGAASTGGFDEQAIYFVAVPKNNAINMLVGGSVGYNAASSAMVENGKIILTTGNRVERIDSAVSIPNPGGGSTTVPVSSNRVDTSIDGGAAGSLTLENVSFSSSAEIFAEDTLTINNLVARSSLSETVDVTATAGSAIDINLLDGDAIAISGHFDLTAGDGAGQGGDVNITITGSSATSGGGGGGPVGIGGPGVEGLVVDGNMTVNTGARGLDDFINNRNNGGTGVGQDAIAGDVTVNIADDGNLQVGGVLTLDASAQGGKGETQNGSATAGNVELTLADGNLLAGVGLSIDTQAIRAQEGKNTEGGLGLLGNDGFAGDITIDLLGGTSDLGAVTISAHADSTDGSDMSAPQINDATGSNFALNVSGGSHAMEDLNVDLSAESVDSARLDPTIGNGEVVRGTAVISVTGTDTVLNLSGGISIDTSTEGVSADVSPSQAVTISVTDTGPSGGLIANDQLFIDTSITRGSESVSNEAGDVSLIANNGQLSVESLDIFTGASPLQDLFFGTDGIGTSYTAGDVSLTATNSGTLSVSTQASIEAEGTAQDSNSAVGVGQGGNVTILADDGSITIGGDLEIDASGFALGGGTAAGTSGEGRGGIVRITVQGADGNIALNDLTARADGAFDFIGEGGFSGTTGLGTNGTGGLTELNLLGGTFSADIVEMSSDGEGAEGGAGFDGGEGIGGAVTINLDGAAANINSLEVSASGSGGNGGFGGVATGGLPDVPPGVGGEARGGTATLNANSGSLTIANNLTVQADANENFSGINFGGRGGDGDGVAGAEGGVATGGTATINMDGTASVDVLGDATISAQAFGGEGGRSDESFLGPAAQEGGAGGDATGGDAIFNDVAGTSTFNSLTVNASSIGGEGGVSDGSLTPTVAAGGAGGTGTGGTALISLNQDDNTPRTFSAISTGTGGQGGTGANGGAGGLGQGGEARLDVNNVDVVFGLLSVNSSATGGQGGDLDGSVIANGANGGDAIGGTSTLAVSGPLAGFTANNLIDITAGATGAGGSAGASSNIDAVDGGDGGNGGAGTGGTAQFVVSDNAVYQLDADTISLSADASGGDGGQGGGNFGGGGGGTGGRGGDATGGAAAIVATTGADVTLQSFSVPFLISSSGFGGRGGEGGGIDMLSGGGAGTGGDGGNGTGGSPTLSATGATITSGETELFAQGFGGNGGVGGDDGTGPIGVSGNGGIGAGGSPLIEVIEGSPGIITLGDVTINASGTGGTGTTVGIGDGGQVTIRDLSPDPAGLITFGSLTVDATGDPTATGGRLTFESASGPITINGTLDAEVAGDINFDMDGTGQVVVTNNTSLTATQDITATHANNGAGNATIDTDATINAFTAVAGRDFLFGAGTFIDAVGAVDIEAQNVAYDDITSTRTVNIEATTGSITGTATGTITGSNILDAITLLASQNVTFGNLLTPRGNVRITATNGGITGASLRSEQSVVLNAAGLIAVETIEHTNAIGLMNITGGSVDIGTLSANFIANIAATTGDLAIDDLTTTDSVDLDAAGSITLGTADVGGINANATGDFTVNSLTTSQTAAIDFITSGGTATYTDINSSRGIEINAVSIVGGDLVGAFQVDLEAEIISIGDATSTGGFLNLTSNSDGITAGNLTSNNFGVSVDSAAAASLGDINANGQVRLVTLTDLTLGDATTNGSILINTGGDLTGGNLTTNSTSVGAVFTVGGDADVTSVTASGTLDLNITGTLSGGNFRAVGTVNTVDIDAGAVDIDLAESLNQSVDILALNGDAIVGTANSARNTVIEGDNVTLDSGTIGRNLTLNATDGSVNGTGAINVTNTINIDATQDINIGAFTASGVVDMDAGGNITSTGANITGTQVNLTAGGNITANDLITTLSNGANNINVNGVDVTFTSATAENNILITATGDVDVGTLDARGTFTTINAASGAVSVDNAISSGNTTITAQSASLIDSDVGGNLTVTTNTGDIDVAGDLAATAVIDFNSAQNVTIASGASLDAGGSINIDAPGDVVFTGADLAAAIINMTVGGDLTGGTLETRLTTSNNTVDLDITGAIEVDSIVAANNILLDAAAIDVGTLDAINVTADATGAVSVGNAISDNDTDLSGTSVNLDAGTIGGALTVTSTVGDITGNGTITVGGIANLDAAQSIAIGTLDANSILLSANANVLFDNLISPNSIEISATSGQIGANTPGEGNIDSDGDADLTALTIAVGDVDALGSVTAIAGGGDASFGDVSAGTTININALGTPSVASITSGGDAVIQGASVSLSGGNIGGSLGLVAATGDVNLALDGTDQIVVGGVSNIFATGNINVTHTNNATGVFSVDSTGAITWLAQGDITSGEGSIISSDAAVSLRAEGDLSINDVRGDGNIDLSAFGDATVNNATQTGGILNVGAGSIANGGITITAGGDNGTAPEQFDPSRNALITGDINSNGFIRVEAGGNAVFQSGSSTVSENGLAVVTGDDIIIQSDALVEAASSPVTTPNTATPFASSVGDLVLDAGALRPQLLTTAFTPLSSIVIEGTVEANDFAAVMTANAIDGLGGTVSASSFTADIDDAPAAGFAQSDDNGLLSANCVEGNICLGTINANNQISIGQASNNDTIQLIIEQGTVNANTIEIFTRNDIVMGTDGIATVLNATDNFSLDSDAGNINLRDASITSDRIEIDAAGSLLGNADLISTNDIGISVGDSIAASSIVTDGELTDSESIGGPIEGFFGVPGDFSVGFFQQDSADIDISAGGDINIGQAVSPNSIFLTADGDAFLGIADVTGDIDVFGGSVGFDDLAADGSVILEANAASIIASGGQSISAGQDILLTALGDVEVGSLLGGRFVTIDAGGNALFGDLFGADVGVSANGSVLGFDIDAAGNATVDGANIEIEDVTAGLSASIDGTSITVSDIVANEIDLTSASNILFDSLQSPNTIALTATNGLIGTNTGSGDIDSDANITLDAQIIAVGNVASQTGAITANATDGNASFGAVNAATDITIEAAGTPSVLNAISGGDTSITGSSVTLDNGTIGGDLSLTATAGDINGDGSVSVEGGINFTASGDVGFGSLDAQGGSFVVNSGGDIDFTNATSSDLIEFTADGSVEGEGLTATNSVSVDAGNIVVGDVISDQIDLASANDILFDLVQSPNAIALTANNGRIGQNTAANQIISDAAVTLVGQQIDVADVQAGGDVTATSTVGTLTLDNTISGGTIRLDGTGDIFVDHAEADGDFIANGQAGITTGLNSIITPGNIEITVAAIADLGNSSAGGFIDVTAGQIDFVALDAGGTVTLLTQDFAAVGGAGNGDITGTNVTAGPGASSFTATSGNITVTGTAQIGGSLTADALGDISINTLNTLAGGFTGTAGGTLGFNSITSADFVDMDAEAILGTGPVDADGFVLITGRDGVTIDGFVSSGDALDIGSDEGSIDVGNLDSVGATTLLAPTGSITTGTIDAGGDLTANALGDISSGNTTSGGTVSATSTDGAVIFGTIDAAGDVALNGIGVTTSDVESGGNVDVNANAGNAALGTIDANGAIDVVAAGSATVAALNSGTNSTVTAGTVSVTNGGTVGGNLTLNATADNLDALGTFTVGGAIDLDAAGDITFGSLDAAGGAFTADAGGSIDFTQASASGLVDLGAQTTITGGDVSSDTSIDLDAVAGPIVVGDLAADGTIDVVSGDSFTANDITQTDGNLTIDAAGDVTFNNASGASGVAITTGAAGGVSGNSLASNNSVQIDTGTGGVDLGTLTTGTAGITAAGGPIDIDDAVMTGLLTASGSAVDIQSSTDLTVDADASAGDVQVIAQGNLDAIGTATGDVALVSLGGDTVINGASGQNVNLSAGDALDVVGTVTAANALTVDANGLFTLDATAIGETIQVNAGDVDITVDGQLGDATVTQSVTFNGFDEMLIGGAGGSGAPYEVDNDEFSRIHSAGDVTFQVFAQQTGAPALITVDTLDVIAGDGSAATGQNIGQASGLVLQSDGDISVIGDANVSNATLDTLFIAEAANLVRVNSETGGIFILDGNGGLAGVIEITATDFNAVTDDAFADIQGMSVADIDTRLGDSDGVDRPDGILRADTLDIDTTASQVFIQNTVPGTDFADRRGFDVNTLLISDSGGTIQPIVINGLIGGVAGIDTIPLADITSTFDTASTINGCLIGNPASCAPVIVTPMDPVDPQFGSNDTRDLIEEGLEPEDSPIVGTIQAGLLEYIPTAEFGQEPLIDEPVTGAGNEDLWVDPECPPGSDPEICGAEPAE